MIPWMWQGLEGAPRRFAVLPDQYLTMSQLALPFVALIVVGYVAVALGARRQGAWSMLLALLLVAGLLIQLSTAGFPQARTAMSPICRS